MVVGRETTAGVVVVPVLVDEPELAVLDTELVVGWVVDAGLSVVEVVEGEGRGVVLVGVVEGTGVAELVRGGDEVVSGVVAPPLPFPFP